MKPPASSSGSPPAHRVVLLGFSEFERGALASYLRLSPQRQPAYLPTELAEEADFIVVDADQPDMLREARRLGRVGEALFIGAQAPEDAGAWMTRPIDPLHVLRELDVMVVMRRQAGRGWMHAPERAAAPPPSPRAAPATRGVAEAPAAAARGRAPAVPPREAHDPRVDVLIVDDSEIALRFLEKHLSDLGLTTQRAAGSPRALELLSQRPFRLALIDIELGDESPMDGLALCHRIRHAPPLPGFSSPLVALVSAQHGPSQQVRATLAGADAFFPKPMDLTILRQFLSRHGVVRRGPPS